MLVLGSVRAASSRTLLLLLAVGVVLATVIPVGRAAADPVCGETSCVEIVAANAAVIVDTEAGASVGFEVTVSDRALFPLTVDVEIPAALILDEDAVFLGALGAWPVSVTPGGFRLVIPEQVEALRNVITFQVAASDPFTPTVITATTTFTDGTGDHTASATSTVELEPTDLLVYLQSPPGPVAVSHRGRSVVAFGASYAGDSVGLVSEPVTMTLTVSPGFSLAKQIFGSPFPGTCDAFDARTVQCTGIWSSFEANVSADPGTPRGTTGEVTATLNTPATDRNPDNDVLTVPIIDVGTANLAVVITPTEMNLSVGESRTATVTVTNNGPDPADGAVLDLKSFTFFPDSFAAAIDGRPLDDRNAAQFSLDGLAPGASLSVPVTITAKQRIQGGVGAQTYVYSSYETNGNMCSPCFVGAGIPLTITEVPVTPPVSSSTPDPVASQSAATTTLSPTVVTSSTPALAGPALANTGAHTTDVTVLAVVLIAAGGLFIVLARRRPGPTSRHR